MGQTERVKFKRVPPTLGQTERVKFKRVPPTLWVRQRGSNFKREPPALWVRLSRSNSKGYHLHWVRLRGSNSKGHHYTVGQTERVKFKRAPPTLGETEVKLKRAPPQICHKHLALKVTRRANAQPTPSKLENISGSVFILSLDNGSRAVNLS